MIITNIWENKKCSKPPTSHNGCMCSKKKLLQSNVAEESSIDIDLSKGSSHCLLRLRRLRLRPTLREPGRWKPSENDGQVCRSMNRHWTRIGMKLHEIETMMPFLLQIVSELSSRQHIVSLEVVGNWNYCQNPYEVPQKARGMMVDTSIVVSRSCKGLCSRRNV